MRKSLIAISILGGALISCNLGKESYISKKKDTKQKEIPTRDLFLYEPYEYKNCKPCHDQKGSYEWVSDFCLICHEEKIDKFSKDYVHRPAIEDCTKCHDPHKSKFEHLLKNESETLCLACHESDLEGNKIHSNLEKTCTECHDLHTSEYVLLLKKGGHETCLLCHTQEEYENKKLDKSNLTIDGCKSCHVQKGSGRCCEEENPSDG